MKICGKCPKLKTCKKDMSECGIQDICIGCPSFDNEEYDCAYTEGNLKNCLSIKKQSKPEKYDTKTVGLNIKPRNHMEEYEKKYIEDHGWIKGFWVECFTEINSILQELVDLAGIDVYNELKVKYPKGMRLLGAFPGDED